MCRRGAPKLRWNNETPPNTSKCSLEPRRGWIWFTWLPFWEAPWGGPPPGLIRSSGRERTPNTSQQSKSSWCTLSAPSCSLAPDHHNLRPRRGPRGQGWIPSWKPGNLPEAHVPCLCMFLWPRAGFQHEACNCYFKRMFRNVLVIPLHHRISLQGSSPP